MSHHHIRLVVALPDAPQAATLRKALQAVLTAYASDLNARGGIFHRHMQWVWGDAETPASEAIFAALILSWPALRSHVSTSGSKPIATYRFRH